MDEIRWTRLGGIVLLAHALTLDASTGSAQEGAADSEAAEATPEEIFLQQRERSTDLRFSLSAGFTYTFGSIYSNVVNPRFGG